MIDQAASFAIQINDTSMVKVIEQIYRLNLDNRVLNNLRQQLNEMIEDGHVLESTFNTMFYMYFKGEQSSSFVYDLLLPIISDDVDGTKLVKIQKLI